MKRVSIIFALSTVAALAACVEHRGTFSLASSRWAPQTNTSSTPVEGRACYNPFGSATGAIREATEQALSNAAGANALSDVSLSLKGNCFIIRGQAFLLQ
jgi:hypothetical protein